jgi:hypothetical protein
MEKKIKGKSIFREVQKADQEMKLKSLKCAII